MKLENQLVIVDEFKRLPPRAMTQKALRELCLAKTLRVRRINDLGAHLPGALFAMIH